MNSSYLAHGGAEREAVITDLWHLFLERYEENRQLTMAELQDAVGRINEGWHDTERSLAVALTGKAHSAVMSAVEALSDQVAHGSPVSSEDLKRLHEALEILRTTRLLVTEAALAPR